MLLWLQIVDHAFKSLLGYFLSFSSAGSRSASCKAHPDWVETIAVEWYFLFVIHTLLHNLSPQLAIGMG